MAMIKTLYKLLVPRFIRKWIAGLSFFMSIEHRHLVQAGMLRAQELREARKADGKIRVTFIVQRPAWWPNQASVYEGMADDAAFEVSVIALPKIPASGADVDLVAYRHLQSFLVSKGIAFHLGYDEQARAWVDPLQFGLPDVVFLPQPYTHTQHFMYHSPYLRNFCSLAIIPYSMTTAHLPGPQYFLPVYQDCRWIFVESEPHRELFLEYAPGLADRLAVVGHPKLDLYRKPIPAQLNLWKSPGARKRIIWAPHFSVTDDRTPLTQSTFFRYYDFFLDFARHHAEVEVVLRPHPELFEHMIWSGLRSREESNAYRDRFNALPNTQVYEGGDIFDMFRQSDALILDSCGFLLEYLPAEKPICYLESMRRQRLNPVGERVVHASYTAWDARELEEFLGTVVLAGNDYRLEERRRIASRYLYFPPGGAAAKIIESIRERVSPVG